MRSSSFKKGKFWLILLLIIFIIGTGLLGFRYFSEKNVEAAEGSVLVTELPVPERSNYDDTGFLINLHYIPETEQYADYNPNWDPEEGELFEKADSGFYMALQALNYCLQENWTEAYRIWRQCEAIDFYRHPTIYREAITNHPDDYSFNGTSMDMMLPWDYMTKKWPKVGEHIGAPRWTAPDFHKRHSAFPEGQNRDMYISLNWVKTELQDRINRPQFEHDYFRNNLTMFKVGYWLARDDISEVNKTYLKNKVGELLKILEGKTLIDGKPVPNVFFRNIIGMTDFGDTDLWYRYWYDRGVPNPKSPFINNGGLEWEFQRDPTYRDGYKTDFGTDVWIPSTEIDGKRLTLGRQFVENVTGQKVPVNCPQVVSTLPQNNAKNISVNSEIKINFDEDVIFLDQNSFYLKDSKGNKIDCDLEHDLNVYYGGSGGMSFDSKQAILRPKVSLKLNERYTVTATTKIQDRGRSSLKNNYTWSFTTNSEDILLSDIATPDPSDQKNVVYGRDGKVNYHDFTFLMSVWQGDPTEFSDPAIDFAKMVGNNPATGSDGEVGRAEFLWMMNEWN